MALTTPLLNSVYAAIHIYYTKFASRRFLRYLCHNALLNETHHNKN